MTKPQKPQEPAQPAKTSQAKQPGAALEESALEQVSGGKTTLSDIKITKTYDKSSPSLG